MPAWDTRGRLWSKPINEKIFDFEGNSWGAGPRATPTVADGMIFTLAADGELAAVDVANFVETTGHYRIAMKGRSGTTIENSTVPPILSRAKPVLLAKLGEGCAGRAAPGIAVGTAIAGRPPHRSVREVLPHTAPPLGQTITTQCVATGRDFP